MDTQASQVSKPQWRFNRPHRVRLFMEHIPFSEVMKKNPNDIYWELAHKFKETPQYAWVDANDIKLDWEYNADEWAFHKTGMFYADLSETEFLDYSLRFFDHNKESWK